MKYFSMFSGIGGFELGIERAYGSKSTEQGLRTTQGQISLHDKGGRKWEQKPHCVGFSEVNKYAIQIYQRHFQGHKNYGDATRIVPEEIPDFDLLCGGFPCQAFSIAGKRGGFKDTRGTLFFEIARILSVKRPQLLLLENVKGLLSHDRGRTFGTILATLSELGYLCEWQVLNSKDFGVPQNRERVFIVGHLGGEGGGEVFPVGEDGRRIIEGESRVSREIQSEGLDTDSGLPDSEVSQDGKDGHLHQIVGGSQGMRVYNPEGIATTVASQAGGLGAKTGLYAIPVLTPNRQEKRQNGRRMKEDGEPAFTLTSQDIHGVYDGMRIRRLTPTECERLQGFPDGWTEGLSDSQRYKCLGNAVTVNVIAAIMNNLFNTAQPKTKQGGDDGSNT